jgi:hypothetical protein
MAVETVTVNCVAGSYTRIAENKTNCSFRLRTIGTGRMMIASAQPAANVTDFIPVSSREPTEIGSMSGTEDVWFMPDGDSAIDLAIIRG